MEQVDDLGDLTTGYFLLIWGKVLILVALGGFGYAHRRRILAGGLQRPGAFARLAAVEVGVMGLAIGLAVALGRTPPPEKPVRYTLSNAVSLTGYPAQPR